MNQPVRHRIILPSLELRQGGRSPSWVRGARSRARIIATTRLRRSRPRRLLRVSEAR